MSLDVYTQNIGLTQKATVTTMKAWKNEIQNCLRNPAVICHLFSSGATMSQRWREPRTCEHQRKHTPGFGKGSLFYGHCSAKWNLAPLQCRNIWLQSIFQFTQSKQASRKAVAIVLLSAELRYFLSCWCCLCKSNQLYLKMTFCASWLTFSLKKWSSALKTNCTAACFPPAERLLMDRDGKGAELGTSDYFNQLTWWPPCQGWTTLSLRCPSWEHFGQAGQIYLTGWILRDRVGNTRSKVHLQLLQSKYTPAESFKQLI